MNSLEIYQIQDVQDIINDYKEHFEHIDKLEHELDYGSIDIEFSYNFDKIRFEVDIRESITNVYINGILKCTGWEFQDYFYKQSDYLKEAIIHYFAGKLFDRYSILPFDMASYYENVDALLFNIFFNDMDDDFEGFIDKVEKVLIDEFYSCQFRHQELDGDVITCDVYGELYCNLNSRKLLDEIHEYLENENPFMVRDNLREIIQFFDDIKNNDF